MLRRLRAVLGIAFTWALVWLPLGLGLALYAAARAPQPSDVISRPVVLPLFVAAWTAWGGMSGAVFALVLGFAERRRTINDLSLPRTALWGALGSMTLPALLTLIDLARMRFGSLGYGWWFPVLALVVSAILGAACAAVTLTVARRSTS